jgi:hypothetical protein
MKKYITVLAALLVAVVAMGQDPAKVYGVKSGTIKTVMNMMGQDVENITYFDDYGAKQATEMEMMGMKMTTIMRDGKTYMVNAAEKQVQEMPGRDNINYLNLTPEIIKKYNVKEVGKETVAGKECIKYTAEIEQMGQKAKVEVSVWQGIAMKNTVDMGEFSITQTVKEVKEGPVDAKLFEIPKF